MSRRPPNSLSFQTRCPSLYAVTNLSTSQRSVAPGRFSQLPLVVVGVGDLSHYLNVSAGSGVHDHLEQGQGGDLDVLEEVRVFFPGFGAQHALLGVAIVLVNVLGGRQLHHLVGHFPRLLGDRALR